MFSNAVFHFMRVSMDILWAYGHSKMSLDPQERKSKLAQHHHHTFYYMYMYYIINLCKKCFLSLHGVFGPVICQLTNLTRFQFCEQQFLNNIQPTWLIICMTVHHHILFSWNFNILFWLNLAFCLKKKWEFNFVSSICWTIYYQYDW